MSSFMVISWETSLVSNALLPDNRVGTPRAGKKTFILEMEGAGRIIFFRYNQQHYLMNSSQVLVLRACNR